MRFSVIIPAHNTAEYLPKCLNSIRVQTFTDYEIICICDSCNDNTEQIARAYADIVEVVDYHTDGLTRNRGLDIAKGEYIIFIDSDDWFLHEYVFQQLNDKLIAESSPDVLAFSFIIKNHMYARPKDNGTKYWTACWTKVYKHSFIADTRFSDKRLDSDVDFTNAVLNKHPRIVEWDMPLYYYNYLRPGSYEAERHKK